MHWSSTTNIYDLAISIGQYSRRGLAGCCCLWVQPRLQWRCQAGSRTRCLISVTLSYVWLLIFRFDRERICLQACSVAVGRPEAMVGYWLETPVPSQVDLFLGQLRAWQREPETAGRSEVGGSQPFCNLLLEGTFHNFWYIVSPLSLSLVQPIPKGTQQEIGQCASPQGLTRKEEQAFPNLRYHSQEGVLGISFWQQ